jgi:Mpv17 / PMP22 family
MFSVQSLFVVLVLFASNRLGSSADALLPSSHSAQRGRLLLPLDLIRIRQPVVPRATTGTDNVYASIFTNIRGGGGAAAAATTRLKSSAVYFAAVDAFWRAHPLAAAAVVCAIKAGSADLVAQAREHHKKKSANGGSISSTATSDHGRKFDRRRSLSFILYGAIYQGAIQELIYNNLYNAMFGTATTVRVAVQKVLFDAIFHNALVCIPMAYVVKALVRDKVSVLTGIRNYIQDVRYHGLLLKYYTLWMPVNAMLFTIVPPHWRISVMALVSFFWMILLSTISSRSRE